MHHLPLIKDIVCPLHFAERAESQPMFALAILRNKLIISLIDATGCTAKSLSFGCSNRLTVYNYTLYKKKENKKAVVKYFNGLKQTTGEKARASI